MEGKMICKYFLKNNCTHGDKCNFIHDKDVCKNFFFEGKCKNIECIKIFSKKFRMLIITNGYCEDCTNNNKAKKVSVSRIEISASG